ncbi:hypothetical protein [Flavobacterium gawalongense]|uniref:Uncharacterized protein n=1 Tax=Flavobacterium gawalongense TaxID=2594432 RepID=A0A553BN32_9FLAO|nr:hypothetical protein [Flavobacterium gawalongense]TRW97020.1 hypothetical protein FNW33_16990 [Flavobacterium gawalongense]TRX01484.1 hypothetical protein FNW12_17025 [Flavobacterium gawalongense]TRX09621.1 hypothetical protein FNW11_08955 [Flavobacterium gawalongense]TRX10895.1 hypothetical protein FNW10_09065 [Flavobacterium gawalongense]TRX28026.1 hypothetical protein FNW38_08425 [Flavobacterium gawalongense]
MASIRKNINLFINIIISITVFIFIFYSNMGKSGGDMAIVIMNFIFGFIQLISVLILGLFSKKINYKIIIAIICMQIIEIFVFVNFGREINEYYKAELLLKTDLINNSYQIYFG